MGKSRKSNTGSLSGVSDNAPTKEKGYMGRDSETTDKRSNLASANAHATAKKRTDAGGKSGKETAGGKGEKSGKDGKRKPTEDELVEFAQDLDRNMIAQAQTNFRKGLIASVLVVVIVVVLIIVAKYFLGIGVEG